MNTSLLRFGFVKLIALGVLAFTGLTERSVAVLIDDVDWAYNWEGSTLPQNSLVPNWNVSGTPTSNAGNTATVLNDANYVSLATGQWFGGGEASGPASTVEFRVKLLTQGLDQPWGTAIGLGWNGVQFQVGLNLNGANKTVELTNNNGAGGGGTMILDTSIYHTYRVVFDSGEASLYVDGVYTGISNIGSGGFANTFSFGRFTGDVSLTGTSEWDYIRWTNDGAFVPVPEPGSFSLAAVAGLLALCHFRKGKSASRTKGRLSFKISESPR